ncbi:hypothetical protein Hanom_Chr15g01380721 [Helianthus anomalus]
MRLIQIQNPRKQHTKITNHLKNNQFQIGLNRIYTNPRHSNHHHQDQVPFLHRHEPHNNLK